VPIVLVREHGAFRVDYEAGRLHLLANGCRSQATVLARSTIRAAEDLGASQNALAKVLGLSESTVSRMRNGFLAPVRGRGKAFELEALFVRCYVSLDVS
jgi:hypothetical protein